MLKIFNTLTRKKETFRPIKLGFVGMYTCGPTVYWYAHIGNLRTYLFEDILKRVLLYNGFKVKHVMSITDVGHLTSDAEEGEDKMITALRREGKELTSQSVLEVAEFYTKAFKKDINRLNIIEPDVWCKATDYIPEMIELIKRIEKNGYTYKTSVGLIYDTSKYRDYAKLGRLSLKQLKKGARVEPDPDRRNPSDFALWITNQPKHIMQWDSPWQKGFPGWHIECSAMSIKYLGEHFDIHCGGKDHIPIHHTNEIAQSEAAIGKKWVNYWIHGEFLNMGGKMAKSSGKIITMDTLIERGFEPLDYRYFCLTAHYRSSLDFSWESLEVARNSFRNLKERILEMKRNPASKGKGKIEKYKKRFLEKINNNMGMPEVLALVWETVKDDSIGNKEKLELLMDFDRVLGLDLYKVSEEEISEEIKKLIEERKRLRNENNFEDADKIRKELAERGIILEDTPQGTRVKKK